MPWSMTAPPCSRLRPAGTFLEDGHERRCEAADAMREGKDYVCGEKLSVTSQDGKNHAVTLAKRAVRARTAATAHRQQR